MVRAMKCGGVPTQPTYLARYLRGQPWFVQKIKLDVDGIGDEVKIIVDSDWAGRVQTRRSTNGACIMVGDICLKAWSTTQRVVALSSGEAETYAAVKGASEGLGFLGALTWEFGPTVWYRSEWSACKGFAREEALGRFDTLILLCCGFRTGCEKAESGWAKSQKRRIPPTC